MRYIGSGQAGGWESVDNPLAAQMAGKSPATYHAYQAPKGIPITHSAPAPKNTGGNVKAIQQFLRSKGYAISVDGIRGPQTDAAIAAYHHGITAKAWNARSVHSTAKTPTRPTARTSPTARTTPNAGPPRYTQVHPAAGGANPQAAAAAASAGIPATSGGMNMTEEQQAQAAINAIYGPQEGDINAQIAAAQAAGAQNVANLGKWYGDVVGTAKSIGDQTAQADQGLIAGQNQANTNLLNLFGGPGANGAAGEAAAFADINNAALAQNAQADQSFNANLQPIIQTQGTEAQNAAQQATAAQLADLHSKFSDLTAAKAQDYYKTLTDIHNTNVDAQQKQDAIDLANRLAAPKLAKANADAKLAGIKAKLAIPEYNMKVSKLNADSQQRSTQNAFRYAEIYGVGPDGRPTLAARKAAAADAKKSAPKASQLQAWSKVAESAYKGSPAKYVKDTNTGTMKLVPGTGTPAKGKRTSYYQVIRHIMSMGATLNQAQKTANVFYHRGAAGRPWVSLQGRQALEKAGMPVAHPMDVPSEAQWKYLHDHNLLGD